MSNTSYVLPLISITLATYNGEKFLEQQLDSLLGQTYRNLEIVISDDNSTDRTPEILRRYAQRDKRIVLTVNQFGRGVIENFTSAIRLAKGDIIFFCDQDDIWYKEKVAQHVAAYADPHVQWVYNEVQLINELGEKIGLLTDRLPDYWTRRKLLYYTWGSCVLGCATSYRAKCIRDLWPADKNAPGHDSWIQLAIYPARSWYIPKILQDYRQHSTNVVGFTVEEKFNIDVEKKAIANNLEYLKSLIRNDRLQLWKRFFFWVVLRVKNIRRVINSVVGKV